MKEKKNILIVDDEVIILDVLKRRLERMGFVVKIAHDGQRAIDILQSEQVDLIVCDATLPVSVDSHEVLKVSRTRHPHASFVAMSGHLEADESVQRLMCGGASLFIKKPFPSLREVTREIADLLTSA
ncbi:MAG: response regulator [bacterium]